MNSKKFMESATLHGFGRIFTSKSRLSRLFWLCFMLCFSGLLGYHLYLILSRYFSNLSVFKDETIIASEMEFPAITICGPTLSNSKHTEFTKHSNLSSSFGEVDPANDLMENFQIFANIGTKEKLHNLTGDREDFLLKKLDACFFGLMQYCNYTTDYEEVLVLLRGYCHRFNPRGTIRQKRSGSEYGFSIILFLNTSDMMPDSYVKNGDALEIIIQHHSEYPFIDTGTVLVPTGQLSHIQIQKTETERMQAPYPSKCTNGKGVELVFPGEYTTTNCLESCFITKSTKICSGMDFYGHAFLPKEKHKRLAKTADEARCLDEVYFNLSKSNFSECNCALPCFETKYQNSVSYSKWPATVDLPSYKEKFSKALGLNASTMTDDYLRNNFMKISIFYPDMTYRRMKEEKKHSFEGLVSDVGGQMGIWLGASVFSIIELMYVCGQIVRGFFSPRKEKADDVVLENIKIEK